MSPVVLSNYDLSERNPGDYDIALRWAVLGVLLIVAAFIALLAVQLAGGLSEGSGPAESSAINISILIGVLAICIVAHLGLGPGAIACTWNPEEFTFHYRNGRVRSFQWRDRRFRCKVTEFVAPTVNTYYISTTIPFLTPITQELYDAILAEANRRGLRIRSEVTRTPGGTQTEVRVSR